MCDVGPRCPAGFAGRVADTERAAGSLVDGLLIGVGGNERGLLGGRGAEGAVAADAVRAEPAGTVGSRRPDEWRALTGTTGRHMPPSGTA